MNPTEIGQAYDQLAEQWNSDAFPRHNGIAPHERAIAFCRQKRHALDVGCGSSGRIVDVLTSHGFGVDGVDVSTRMIDLARRRHPDVAFHHADVCEWTLPRRYDLISAWDSIWHVPLTGLEPLLAKLMRALAPGGVFIFTTGGVDSPGESVDSTMGPRVYYSALGIPRTLEVISECGCICRHLEYDQHPESHLYVIAQRP
jgi:SAM-dependent methyltransferase